MRVPLEWLKEYVTLRLAPKALAERLTMAGLEVVAVHESEAGPVFDLEVTPNRADCLSITGIAREVAAITGVKLKLPRLAQGSRLKAQGKQPRASSLEPRAPLTIRIEDRKGCRRYIGRLIDGVRVGPSPAWMQKRLAACGARPINSLVDITNYVLLECGQPLHAFDYDRLADGTIVVRRARAGETIHTIDGASRPLSAEMLVIADVKRAIAVAGVMGGRETEITQPTRRILLESAWFEPTLVRRTARALGLASESSYRFERGVDPAGVAQASERAAWLIRQLTGGREVGLRDVGEATPKRTVIVVEPARMNRWLGTTLHPPTIRATLAALSCRVASSSAGEILRVEPPSFRRDLTQEVDLSEELARLVGYDKLPATIPVRPLAAVLLPDASAAYRRIYALRELCASLGLTEAVTWSLVSEAELVRLGYAPAGAVRLANPLSQDHAYVRPSLLPGLLQAVRRNVTQGAVAGVRLFEVGRVMSREAGSHTGELRLGLVLSGLWLRDWRLREPCDFFRLKGLVQAVVERLTGVAARLHAARHPWAETTGAATLQVDGRTLGVVGQVLRTATAALDIEQEVWYAELSVEALLACARPPCRIHSVPSFPPVKRDLSVLVREGAACEAIEAAIRRVGGTLADRIELSDRYTGPQVPAGMVSLTFSLEYRDPSRTLTAAEADALHQRIGQELVQRFSAKLR
ncbi:MAG: phenylalanine--tRNA ligase subunit beta [Candidatus Omnitrophota bacterium]|nr:phenylalanine--tRNA ligase subunit beta [Candidatus Omnitrophota bacterium]